MGLPGSGLMITGQIIFSNESPEKIKKIDKIKL